MERREQGDVEVSLEHERVEREEDGQNRAPGIRQNENDEWEKPRDELLTEPPRKEEEQSQAQRRDRDRRARCANAPGDSEPLDVGDRDEGGDDQPDDGVTDRLP